MDDMRALALALTDIQNHSLKRMVLATSLALALAVERRLRDIMES